jgi:hypothetical protein
MVARSQLDIAPAHMLVLLMILVARGRVAAQGTGVGAGGPLADRPVRTWHAATVTRANDWQSTVLEHAGVPG